jgi:uncharacterized tellurite resistance protein B-like protein
MIWLILPLLLAGVLVAYRLSPASKARRRVVHALLPLEQLKDELREEALGLQNAIQQSAGQYVREVQAARLRAIPLDELKKHGSGMRLQALKDAGVHSLADLREWDEHRISQVRGVGPKSAAMIIVFARQLSATVQSLPILHPTPPFDINTERVLIWAIYLQRWFDVNAAASRETFEKSLSPQQEARDEILDHTRFGSWLWKFGANDVIRARVNRADALCREIDGEALGAVRRRAETALSESRKMRINRVEDGLLVSDFETNRAFYESWLARQLGCSEIAQSAQQVHVEFGRVIAVPPPTPKPRSDSSPEQLLSVTVPASSIARPTEFAVPPPPRPVTSNEVRWVGGSEAITVQGFELTQGFIYVGKGDSANGHFVIDLQLPASRGATTQEQQRDYYPSSYQSLDSETRGRYLVWLQGGAAAGDNSSFAQMYFYGLENRLLDLIENQPLGASPAEADTLREEILRVGESYREVPSSVADDCFRLADFVLLRSLRAAIPELPKYWRRSYEFPWLMRYGLGCYLRDRKPIPVEWALRWVRIEPTIYLRTPATRCPHEFEAAFAETYKSRFGDGLVIPLNKTPLRLSYQPKWPAQRRPIKLDTPGVPDIAALSTPVQTLREIVEESTAAIDSYSRLLGRAPEKAGTLEAYINLPTALWPADAKSKLDSFKAEVVGPIEPLPYSSFLQMIGFAGNSSDAKITEIASNLKRVSIGFEPDILAGARRPKPDESIVLFPLTSEADSDRSCDEYKNASLTVSLSACVALADGHASPHETEVVDTIIGTWQHLEIDQRTRLRAQYRLQIKHSVSLANLRSRFAGLSGERRMQLAQSLSSLATADGVVAATEVRFLEQVYHALDIDAQLLYSHLHQSNPPTVTTEDPLGSDSRVASAHPVDAGRLAILRTETEQVSELLAGVFADEDSISELAKQTTISTPLEQGRDGDSPLPGLDRIHQEFLSILLQQSSWPRAELQAAAAKLRVMLDGALERINDATFDLMGEALTDGDDPIAVQLHILENAE